MLTLSSELATDVNQFVELELAAGSLFRSWEARRRRSKADGVLS